MELIDSLGPGGFFVLLVLGLVYSGKNKRVRRELLKTAERIRLAAWARGYGTSIALARRLQRDEWNRIMEQRRFSGLKRRRIRRTPVGIAVGLGFGGSISLKQVAHRVDQLETALGLVRDSARLQPARHADRATLHIVLRNPLAGDLLWAPRPAPRRLGDPLRLSMTPFGEWVTIDLRNRIGIFGTSGSGKSTVQRNIGAHIIESEDADLEIWDLKHGLESQHFEGKAHRVTTAAEAIARTQWLLKTEFERRAGVMKRQGTSSWKETPENPARIIMIDEGNVLIRDFGPDARKQFFTAVEQGRALGVYFVWVTQFPKSTNLPTELRSQLNIRICLRLESAEETRVVFKDDAGDGWEPHKLDPYFLLIRSALHKTPEESKAVYLSEDVFRSVHLAGSVPGVSEVPVPVVSVDVSVPDNLRPWIVSVSVPDDTDTVVSSLETRVLSLLKTLDGPVGVREIADRIGHNPGSVQRVLKRVATQTEDKKYVWAG